MVPAGCIHRPPADSSACCVLHPTTGELAPARVTLFAGKKSVGVHAQPHDDDWRIPPGQPGNARKGGARPVGRVMDLVDAIAQEHHAEQYAVSYRITRGWQSLPEGVPRMCKTHPSGFDWLSSVGHEATWDVVGLDLDNPHTPDSTTIKIANDSAQTQRWVEQLSRAELDGWGWYVTQNGVRFWRPLRTAITDGDLFERVLTTARAEIDSFEWESFGQSVKTDIACKDMSRLMSLAYILKKGRMFYSPVVDLSRMWAVDYEPAEETLDLRRGHKRPPRAQAEPYDFAPEAPPYVISMLRHITPATLADMRAGVSRHDLMRATAGALIMRGFEPELVPIAVETISYQMGLDAVHTKDDYRGARETVETWQSGVTKITGMASLKRGAPALALAIDQLCSTAKARRDAEIHISSGLPTADAAADEMYERACAALEAEALTIIGGTCGTGKSRLAIRLMVENSQGRFPAGAKGKQLEHASRSVVAPPTQEVAVELQQAARALGVEMVRWTSGLSEREPDGSFVCKHRTRLVLMSEGGLSAQHHGCNGGGVAGAACPERERGCRAALGCVDPDGDPISPSDPGFAATWPMQIATHARLGHALAKLGSRAKALVDEAFPTVKQETLSLRDLVAACEELWESAHGSGMLQHLYARAMLPAAYALRAHLEHGEAPLHSPDLGLVRAMACPVPPEVLALAADANPVVSARMAPFPKSKTTGEPIQVGAPYVKVDRLPGLREHPSLAAKFARVGRVCSLLWRALQPDSRYTGTIVLSQRGTRHVDIIGPSEITELLTQRIAPRILFTADAELISPELSAHFASSPATHPIYVADGSQIDRRLVMHPAAKRSKVTREGRLERGGKHLELLEVAVAWALEAPSFDRLVLVTWKSLATAVRFAWEPSDAAERDWLDQGQTGDLPSIADECAKSLGRLRHLVDRAVLHYGATRGVDAYREFNSLAMVGVPYPNVGAVRAEADHLAMVLGLDADRAEALREHIPSARATAELGQAAGRLRLPRRTFPARLLCITDEHVTPAEWERHEYERRSGDSVLAQIAAGTEGGRPKTVGAMTAEELSAAIDLCGRKALCMAVGVSEASMTRYRSGLRAIPANVADAVRRQVGQKVCSETPSTEYLHRGGFGACLGARPANDSTRKAS